jgi:thiol-disulfide isomerase/thioredoxin
MFKQTPVLLHTQQDFELRSLNSETALCLKNPKTTFSLVFFYGPDCHYCDIMRPIFSRNSGIVRDCTFIMVNLKNNQNLIHISKETKTPIKYVPLILLFHREIPLIEYNGKTYSDEELRKFLVESIELFGAQQQTPQFAPAQQTEQRYTCEDGVCYSSFDVYAGDNSATVANVCYLSFQNAYV